MDTLKFAIHNLMIGNVAVKYNDIQDVSDEVVITNEDGTSGVATFECSERFLWMYSKSGRNMPYSTEVLNTKTQQRESNPRNRDQAELRTQGFCLYDFDSSLLYTSGGVDFLKTRLAKVDSRIRVRNLYKTREQFLDTIRKVSKLRFVAVEDLLNSQSSLFSDPKHKLGLGNPEQVKMEFKFPRADVTREFLDFLRHEGIPNCENGKFKSLVITGESFEEGDRLVASTFNLRNLESSISVLAEKEESGLYNPEEIKQALIGAL